MKRILALLFSVLLLLSLMTACNKSEETPSASEAPTSSNGDVDVDVDASEASKGLRYFILSTDSYEVDGTTVLGTASVAGIGSCEESNIIVPRINEEGYEVVELGEEAFKDVAFAKTIQLPSSVKMIGPKAFSGCISLESVTLPKDVEALYDECFYNCTAL